MRNPSEENKTNWIEHCAEGTNTMVRHEPDIDGKWMLFYPLAHLDSAWNSAKRMFDEGVLTGIAAIKISTAAPDPRRAEGNGHAIIFYTSFHDDTALLEIGRNLVKQMQYVPMNGFTRVYYKLDIQTIQGTRASGAIVNHSLSFAV